MDCCCRSPSLASPSTGRRPGSTEARCANTRWRPQSTRSSGSDFPDSVPDRPSSARVSRQPRGVAAKRAGRRPSRRQQSTGKVQHDVLRLPCTSSADVEFRQDPRSCGWKLGLQPDFERSHGGCLQDRSIFAGIHPTKSDGPRTSFQLLVPAAGKFCQNTDQTVPETWIYTETADFEDQTEIFPRLATGTCRHLARQPK